MNEMGTMETLRTDELSTAKVRAAQLGPRHLPRPSSTVVPFSSPPPFPAKSGLEVRPATLTTQIVSSAFDFVAVLREVFDHLVGVSVQDALAKGMTDLKAKCARDNWDDEGAQRIDASVFQEVELVARQVMRDVPALASVMPRVRPSADGIVYLSWTQDGKRLTLEKEAGESWWYTAWDRDQSSKTGEIEDVVAATDLVRRHF